jgi:hypothetical protein
MRGRHRANAGRPGWRRKCERTLSLDIRELARLGCLGSGGGPFGWHWIFLQTRTESVELGMQPTRERLQLEYRMGAQWRRESIPIDHIACHFGGSRPWLRLPLLRASARRDTRGSRSIACSPAGTASLARGWRLSMRNVPVRAGHVHRVREDRDTAIGAASTFPRSADEALGTTAHRCVNTLSTTSSTLTGGSYVP